MGRRIALLLLFLFFTADYSSGAETSAPVSRASENSLPELLRDLPEREVRAAGFQGMIPGTTTEAEVLEKLGEPEHKAVNGPATDWVYQIGPFPRVELTFIEEKLQLVSAQFASPRPIEEIQKELSLSKFAAVPIYSSDNAVTTLVYPERGLSVGIADDNADQGTSISLISPSAEFFITRARRDRSCQLQQQLADLQQALSMDPANQQAMALQLRIWDDAGFPEEALARAQAAYDQQPSSSLLRLELARLQLRHRQLDAAREHLKQILEAVDSKSTLAGNARLLLVEIARAELKRTGSQSDPRALIDELVQVIRAAAQLTKDASFDQRLEARAIVLQGHLAAARIISESQWRNRATTVTKWLTNTQSIAATHLEQDHAAPSILLEVWESGLACYAAIGGEVDPLPFIEEMTQHVDPWLANSDPLFQRHARTRYAAALLYAARCLQLRSDTQRASIYFRRAVEVAAEIAQQQPTHREAELLLGEGLFNIGATFGVGQSDHETAVTWYDRAEPLLVAPIPAWCAEHRALVGDQMVSIGLSNWEIGQRQRGIELTEKGLVHLQAAAADGEAAKPSLSVALTNLAFMHSAVGNRDKAIEFTELARKLGK